MKKLKDTITNTHFQKLDVLEIELSRKVRQGFQGARRSTGKGSSVEFSDFKAYSPGDDIKRIDWHSYARFDKLFVKQFIEEKQASFNLFIDTIQSMDFGEENKGFYAKTLALSIAYICLKNTDRVNLYAYNNAITARKEKISAKERLFEIIDFLDNLEFGGQTNINQSLNSAGVFHTGASFSFLLSDFFSPEGYQDAAKILAQKGGAALLQILSPEEIFPTLSGQFHLTDSETGERMAVTIDQPMQKQYQKTLSEMRAGIKSFCAKQNISYYSINTNSNVFENLYDIRLLGGRL
jgi:uncharacterized protein (DUF58 family)